MENIKEGNRLIAEFMGKKFFAYKDNQSFNIEFDTVADCESFIKERKLDGYYPELGWGMGLGFYHSDWNWLMLALHKAENIRLNLPSWSTQADHYIYLIMNNIQQYDIKGAFNCLVEFILWYNSNKINYVLDNEIIIGNISFCDERYSDYQELKDKYNIPPHITRFAIVHEITAVVASNEHEKVEETAEKYLEQNGGESYLIPSQYSGFILYES